MMVEELFVCKFIKNIRKSKYVGIEIEMPLVNMIQPYKIDKKIVQKLFKEMLKNDFIATVYDNDNNIISIKNINTNDTISMEYSWNTIEFSIQKELSIYKLIDKFNNYYNQINKYLEKYNYKLCDEGINPNYQYIDRKCLNQDRYKIIEKLLTKDQDDLFSQFCSYCCSVQTHVNVSKKDLIKLFNLFSLISDNKENMFSNSYMEETKLKNSRKYLWNNSNFGPLNIGKNKIYRNIKELKEDYLNRNLFYIQRDNKFYLLKNKTKIIDYFNNRENEVILSNGNTKKFKPNIEDFDNFRSYREVELTKYGTLEIRTDCMQKLNNLFKVVAFNVGISENLAAVLNYIENVENIENDFLIDLAIKGLKLRGYKEEELLKE